MNEKCWNYVKLKVHSYRKGNMGTDILNYIPKFDFVNQFLEFLKISYEETIIKKL